MSQSVIDHHVYTMMEPGSVKNPKECILFLRKPSLKEHPIKYKYSMPGSDILNVFDLDSSVRRRLIGHLSYLCGNVYYQKALNPAK